MKNKYNKPWRYALAMFGLSITGYMYASYGTFFYNDKLGLPLTTIGIATVLFSIWDAFNDPITGFLSDRTRSRFGRRKPWLLSGTPVFVVAAILFFSPPASLGNGTLLAVYFTFFLMLTETANTIATVNYHSLLPELFRETGIRNRANAIRQALQLVGMIIGVSLFPTIVSMLAKSTGDQVMGYRLTAVVLGVLGGALMMYSFLGCREREDFSAMPQPTVKETVKAVALNRNFWLVSVSHFFYQATTGLLLAGIPFFIKYALNQPDAMATILSACVFVSAIPSMYLWYRLINRLGTLKVWRLALLWLALSLGVMYFAGEIVFASVAGVLVGIGIAGVTANLDMVNSELIEEDAKRNGVRREATFFAAISFVTRLSGLIRSGVFAMLGLWFGYQSSTEPGPQPGNAARFMMVVFPFLLMIISFAVSQFVRIKAVRQADDAKDVDTGAKA
jgi:glycoside/pentoside/hexuronide:cation symporter, GPH family